ncbi:hypothetical protein [Nocardia transvalensis]|uniref:hypothetical protein n=1 Tax=Nocardia transvalensis TaxID=37333 RepID=UPI0018930273|nr:hypothetical protein [Nocardia transvalensis]MBF6333496.1 hypothetical protein [Nocardia transvalensis]
MTRKPPDTARFDPGLPALEDWDMWLQLSRAHRYRFTAVDTPTVVYHRLPAAESMCAATVAASAGLAGFGRLVQWIWARWPATDARSERFRLYVGVLYWQALTVLAEGRRLAEDYWQAGMAEIAAAWHGELFEHQLRDRIIAIIEDGSRDEPAC